MSTNNPVEILPGATAPVNPVDISKQINDLVTWYQANPTKVTEFITQLSQILAQLILNQPPPPPPPPPGPTGDGIGPDGVIEIHQTNPNAKAKPFYINIDNPDENSKTFAVMYGGDITKFEKTMTEGNIKFVRNMGHKQTYASGAPPGKSCRFHISAGGNMRAVGKHSWKDNPTPMFVTATDQCYYSHEMTVIVRVGKALGTHQSFAFKINTRPDQPDDTLRSTIEMNLPNDQKPNLYANYNYAHAGYESVSGVKQYTKDGKVTVGKWIGAKLVYIIADDRKSTLMQMYVNTDPITADGKPNNKGWILKGEYTAKGIPQYNNVPPVWGGDSYLRVDGYEYVDMFRMSQREILKTAPKLSAHLLQQTTTEPEILQAETEDFNQWEDPNENKEVVTTSAADFGGTSSVL